ncbi:MULTISPECIES: RnfABCDGE type electron transport complex subunit G [Pseudomonas]|uniref:Electron transport complex protein RnfG n=1 Tax=Pseudomonas hunanensis TaxID=1247546 RepID=A0ACC6K826_9PSED|nr:MULTISPECIES: RnfABCDGE type electron transport complex subunit G [Pseudomonas]MBP2263948.1 electron transport complex protein RnfG [Pseudomonas sp. BP8]MDR6714593.1 electron transport complex protein RnfG [Pseudomonas hunanensis]HDS1736079.1 RnfABCDGE type electron transport complex subunit G [Pseudomonas putida]
MNAWARQALLLTLLGSLSVAATLTLRHCTRAPIEQAQRELDNAQWLTVLPSASYDNDPLQAPLDLPVTQLEHSQLLAGYRATQAGKPSAVLLRSLTQGYAGPIELVIAIDRSGRLLGISVVQQQESPGLGDRLVDPSLHWLEQFTGRSLDDGWALRRDQGDFDQLAGATVTSRAVLDALQDALRYFDSQQARLLETRRE